MYGVVKLPRHGLSRSEPSPYRRFSCSLCVGFRRSFGLLGPLLHTTDLAFFALLGPADDARTTKSHCSAVPFFRPTIFPPDGPLLSRLRSLGLSMAALREFDADLDGDRRGPVRRFLRKKTGGERAETAFALLGVTGADLESVARETKAREARPGSRFEKVLAPVTGIARRMFAAVFDGLRPAADAANLGAAYVETLSLLDGFEDREADRRAGRFNVCDDTVFDGEDGPAEQLIRSAETFGGTALGMAPAAHVPQVRTALDASLSPRIVNAVSGDRRRQR